MNIRTRIGQVILVLLFVLCGVISISTAFADDPFPFEAIVLIASFGATLAVLGVVVTLTALDKPAIRLALWVLPLFFVSHVALLGTWVPDAILAVVSAITLVLVSLPSKAPARAEAAA